MISVLHSPLFTAVFSDGHTERLGLLKLLGEAHNIESIKANSCTGKLALLRLCIAFLSEVYVLKTLDDRGDLLDAGAFDTALLNAYVKKCEAEGCCFLLDDKKCPFMQAAYDPVLDAKAEKPVAKILFDCPGGNNHIHLDHRYEDDHEADVQAAFEAMLETYLFCPAGLSGASNVNNTPPVYAIVHGRTLFETLVLNMVSSGEIARIPFGAGEAAWRLKEAIIPGTKVAEMSLIRALTWQPRRMTLQWDEDGIVRRVFLQNGLNFQGNGLWRDPHVIFHRNRDGSLSSVKPDLDRALWRDAGNLINNGSNLCSTVPLQNIEQLWTDAPAVLDIELTGMTTNNEAILGRVNERLRLPITFFISEDAAQDFRGALDVVEVMARVVDNAVKWQYCHPSDKNKKSVVAQQAVETFLYGMHGILFGSYIDELEAGIPAGERHERFFEEMWQVLDEDILGGIVERTGNDVPTLKCQNAVRAKIRKEYRHMAGKES